MIVQTLDYASRDLAARISTTGIPSFVGYLVEPCFAICERSPVVASVLAILQTYRSMDRPDQKTKVFALAVLLPNVGRYGRDPIGSTRRIPMDAATPGNQSISGTSRDRNCSLLGIRELSPGLSYRVNWAIQGRVIRIGPSRHGVEPMICSADTERHGSS